MATAPASAPFEIGLVGAGAISAGAYTGGVVDFLTFALDSWYAAQTAGLPNTPPHKVQLRVFSGASAGAITAALSSAYLCSDQPPIASEFDAIANKGKNKLFDSWVERIDISYLLQSRDLAGHDGPVTSLLDSTVLTEIADSGLNVSVRPTRRAYVAPNFELLMTVSNLRGVPYAFQVTSSKQASYDMSLHADYVHFRINDSGDDLSPDRYTMAWAEFGGASVNKDKMKIAALASGAFPIGLAPRTLGHDIVAAPDTDWYSARTWPIPTPHSENPHACIAHRQIAANWGSHSGTLAYSFQCVDGGVMNNEPFELARKQLAGAGGRNEREGVKASKAVLMIDPFPSNSTFDPRYADAPDLLGAGMKLFGALKNQARFKPDELMLAADENVASRYMIAPSRGNELYPIACGSLGGFGGFLKRDFRAHDYFLGRRNAQRFFSDHFVLPEKNPLFVDWDEDMRKHYCVKNDDGSPMLKDGLRLLPVIPLVGAAVPPCAKPAWPHYSDDDLGNLMKRAEARLKIVSKRLVDQYFPNFFLGWVAKLVIATRKKLILGKLETAVTTELRRMGLM